MISKKNTARLMEYIKSLTDEDGRLLLNALAMQSLRAIRRSAGRGLDADFVISEFKNVLATYKENLSYKEMVAAILRYHADEMKKQAGIESRRLALLSQRNQFPQRRQLDIGEDIPNEPLGQTEFYFDEAIEQVRTIEDRRDVLQ